MVAIGCDARKGLRGVECLLWVKSRQMQCTRPCPLWARSGHPPSHPFMIDRARRDASPTRSDQADATKPRSVRSWCILSFVGKAIYHLLVGKSGDGKPANRL